MDEIEKLLEEFEPEAREEFLRAFRLAADSVPIGLLEERIAAGDLDGATTLLAPPPEVFNQYAAVAVAAAFAAGGSLVMSSLPRLRLPSGVPYAPIFNVRSREADDWIRRQSDIVVRSLASEAERASRAIVSDGIREGRGARTIALDAVGRVSRSLGRRDGGLLAVTTQQVRYHENARAELTSVDPAEVAKFMNRSLRDERLDRALRRTLEQGGLPSASDVRGMLYRYSVGLRDFRAELAALSDVQNAVHSGQAEAIRQALSAGAVSPLSVVKTWRTRRDARVRDSHMALEGATESFGTPFKSPATGASLMHPGDRAHGAAARDVAGCRCRVSYGLRYTSSTGRSRSLRVG